MNLSSWCHQGVCESFIFVPMLTWAFLPVFMHNKRSVCPYTHNKSVHLSASTQATNWEDPHHQLWPLPLSQCSHHNHHALLWSDLHCSSEPVCSERSQTSNSAGQSGRVQSNVNTRCFIVSQNLFHFCPSIRRSSLPVSSFSGRGGHWY